ncbi:MAG: hypothetical protein V1929_07455 [bacterium]
MTRRRNHDDDDEAPPGPGPLRLFFRFFNTLLVLAVIVYGAARAMTFTAGFKNLVEEQILAKFDLPVTIGRVRSNWSCDLEFSDVVSTNMGDVATGGFRAQRIDLEWSLADALRGRAWNLRKVGVMGCTITFVARDGAWEPAALAPLLSWLARWLEVSFPASSNAASAATTNADVNAAAVAVRADGWSKAVFSVRDMTLTWTIGGTGELATAEGVWIDVAPIQVPDREFRYYHLKLTAARAPDGTTIRNVDLEILDTGDQQVVLGFKAERQKAGNF